MMLKGKGFENRVLGIGIKAGDKQRDASYTKENEVYSLGKRKSVGVTELKSQLY